MASARKAWKSKRRGRRMRKASGMKRSKYADTHSFKIQAQETSIYNTGTSGSTTIATSGALTIGTPSASALGVNLWDFGGSFQFFVGNAYQAAQLSTMFDRYKVNGIKVKVIPQFNIAEVAGSGNIPVIRLVRDVDDNSTPTLGDVWSRRGIERRLDKPFSFYFKPNVCNQVWTGPALPLAKAPVKCTYLDMANTGIPLYGYKFGVRNWLKNSTPNTAIVRFEVTYYITCKNQLAINKPGDLDVPPVVLDEEVEGPQCDDVPK